MSLQQLVQQSYEALLEYAVQVRLTLLHPQSRYRSLVVAKLLAEQPKPVFYYAMGMYDVDLDSFLAGFIHDLSEQSPSFGNCLSLILNTHQSKETASLLQALVKDVNGLSPNPFFLIFDEYDASENADDVQHFLEQFLEQAPPQCHVILNSRNLPRLPWLAFIARNEALILNDSELVVADIFLTSDQNEFAQIQVQCFGPGEITKDKQLVNQWEGHLPRLLLIFALERPVVTRTEICNAFWPNLDTDQAVNVFHVTKRRLHKALGFDVLLHEDGYYQLNPKVDTSYDVIQFVSALVRGRMTSGEDAMLAWQQAVDLYKGPFLQGYDDQWIAKQRAAYHQGYLEAVMELAMWRVKSGRAEHALRILINAGQDNITYEPIHHEIMRLYTVLGRRSEAASHYQKWLLKLQAIEVAPSAKIQTLYAQLMS